MFTNKKKLITCLKIQDVSQNFEFDVICMKALLINLVALIT